MVAPFLRPPANPKQRFCGKTLRRLHAPGTLPAFTASSDTDRDGLTDKQEHLADTNPLDPSDWLRITTFTRSGNYNTLNWASRPTRLYRVGRRVNLAPSSLWNTNYIGFDWPGWNAVDFDELDTNAFYRIRAVRPLSP